MVRKGASSELAKDVFKEFDLTNQTVIGINLVSGWYNEPSSIRYKAFEDIDNKHYIIYISYNAPANPYQETISHPVWFVLPALSDGYEITYFVDSKLVL